MFIGDDHKRQKKVLLPEFGSWSPRPSLAFSKDAVGQGMPLFSPDIVKKGVRLNSSPATLGVQLSAIQNDELWQESTTMFC